MNLDELLKTAVDNGASDLHLKVGRHPMMRVHGILLPASGERRLEPSDTAAMASAILSPTQRARFEEANDVDLTYSVPGLSRFRCNIFRQRGSTGLVLRVLPWDIPTIDELRLPEVLKDLAKLERGLLLVTGSTGSGKSTTLAALIDHINRRQSAHIVTIEDPIEYLHRDRRSLVSQREVSVDTISFAHALRSALRQDPNVVLVGEMRDLETIEAGLIAAETGHLVMSTLHTLDATETINRVISVFPPHQQHQTRVQLGETLSGVVSQRLIPRADGPGRVAAVEILIATPLIREYILDPARTRNIRAAMATGRSEYGTQTFDQSILDLVRQGSISREDAIRWATNPSELKLQLQGISGTLSSDAAQELTMDAVEITRFGR